MPIYEYRCSTCGAEFEESLTIAEYASHTSKYLCPDCDVPLSRIFSVSIKTSMPEHYNHSAGEYVSNERQLRDSFKRQSAMASERTGIEHNFVPVDPQDRKKLGVTAEGLDATYNRRRQLGMRTNDAMKITD